MNSARGHTSRGSDGRCGMLRDLAFTAVPNLWRGHAPRIRAAL